MMISILTYFTSFGVSIFLFYLYQNNYMKIKNFRTNFLLLFLCYTPTLIIATIRYGIGTDYFTYIEIFNDVSSRFSLSLIFHYYQEPLNIITYYISYIIFKNEIGMFFLYSLMTLVFISKGIEYYKKEISLSLSIFIYYMVFYHISFNAMRQMIAISIIFYSFKYILNKDFKRYLLFVIIAFLFHNSALIAISFYFLCPLKRKKENSVFHILFYSIMVLSPVIIPIFMSLIYRIISAFGIYNEYLSMKSNINYLFLLYIIPILFIMILYRNSVLRLNYRFELFYKLMFIQIPIQIMGNYIRYIDRLAVYVSISQIIIIPYIIKNVNNKRDKMALTIGIILWYLCYYFIMFILMKSNEVYPYQSIFKPLYNNQ